MWFGFVLRTLTLRPLCILKHIFDNYICKCNIIYLLEMKVILKTLTTQLRPFCIFFKAIASYIKYLCPRSSWLRAHSSLFMSYFQIISLYTFFIKNYIYLFESDLNVMWYLSYYWELQYLKYKWFVNTISFR